MSYKKNVSKIFDEDFPPLPGMESGTTEETKQGWARLRKEIEHKKYLEKEARRKAKKEAARKNAEKKARNEEERRRVHVDMMIEKWGSHRWFNMVEDTEDDCHEAARIRKEHYASSVKWEAEFEERMEREEKERNELIAKKTANMTEEEKRDFIETLIYEEAEKMDTDIFYSFFEDTEISRRDEERLLKFQKKYDLDPDFD